LLNIAGAVLVYVTVSKPLPMREAGHAGGAPFAEWVDRLRNPAILSCLGIGFCILFAFIGTFTYINFVLVAAPFGLGMMSLGLVYLVFLPSIVSTPFGGQIAKRLGTRTTLWISLGVAGLGLMFVVTHNLPIVVLGLALVGIGTFLAQAVATGFISAAAKFDRGVASGLYLASYFLGGLVGSVVLGQLYVRFGWTACVAGIGGALVIAALLAGRLTLKQQESIQAEMLPRHGTDRNSAMAAIAQLGDARINSVRN
jgi:predicted MFS family arabinose efflux permease